MEKFYIGLDIGTESVGIAATDENYTLLRSHGKDMWATRLFDEASTAEQRRTFRTSRRRTARRSQRIDFLQEVFAPYMQDNLFSFVLTTADFTLRTKTSNWTPLTLCLRIKTLPIKIFTSFTPPYST